MAVAVGPLMVAGRVHERPGIGVEYIADALEVRVRGGTATGLDIAQMTMRG
jgi:hypothetical protein